MGQVIHSDGAVVTEVPGPHRFEFVPRDGFGKGVGEVELGWSPGNNQMTEIDTVADPVVP